MILLWFHQNISLSVQCICKANFLPCFIRLPYISNAKKNCLILCPMHLQYFCTSDLVVIIADCSNFWLFFPRFRDVMRPHPYIEDMLYQGRVKHCEQHELWRKWTLFCSKKWIYLNIIHLHVLCYIRRYTYIIVNYSLCYFSFHIVVFCP